MIRELKAIMKNKTLRVSGTLYLILIAPLVLSIRALLNSWILDIVKDNMEPELIRNMIVGLLSTIAFFVITLLVAGFYIWKSIKIVYMDYETIVSQTKIINKQKNIIDKASQRFSQSL